MMTKNLAHLFSKVERTGSHFDQESILQLSSFLDGILSIFHIIQDSLWKAYKSNAVACKNIRTN
jgi:hypothetical protein